MPPGFGEPAPAPTATTAPRAVPTGGGVVPPAVPAAPLASPTPVPSVAPTVDPGLLALYEMPLAARRSTALIGPATPREGGVQAGAFAGADGRFVSALMRRVAAPLPSRWLSILLRRTLAARLRTPRGVDGADFAAERAWLLLRMGEASAARAVVEGVDTADYTPKLYQVAINAMLAAGDPGGLCPLVPGGLATGGDRGWTLVQAMCTALAGNGTGASRAIAQARRRRVATGIDLLLAQKVAGTAGGRQAVTIEWTGVPQLTSWRWGLATATGVAVPDELYDTVGPQVRYWRALAAGLPLAGRLPVADAAAAQGVLSSAALVDLYAATARDDGATAADRAAAQDLGTAYADRSAAARLAALKGLWGTAPRPSYGRLVLTARAAARLPVVADDATDRLVASMLAAGLDRSAARWRDAAPAGGDAWAMIAAGDPDARAQLGYGDLAAFGNGDAARQRIFFAALAGLGRLAPDDVERAAEALDVRIGAGDAWTRALDRAAAAGEQGTVVVLAAVGMQTGDWRGVPPAALYRILGALRAVGLGGEARMIAAEAIARS